MKSFSSFNIKPDLPLTGSRVSITSLYGKTIVLTGFKQKVVEQQDVLLIQFKYKEDDITPFVFLTRSTVLRDQFQQLPPDAFPFLATVINKDNATYLV